jgi:hypothetical protein
MNKTLEAEQIFSANGGHPPVTKNLFVGTHRSCPTTSTASGAASTGAQTMRFELGITNAYPRSQQMSFGFRTHASAIRRTRWVKIDNKRARCREFLPWRKREGIWADKNSRAGHEEISGHSLSSRVTVTLLESTGFAEKSKHRKMKAVSTFGRSGIRIPNAKDGDPDRWSSMCP